MPSLRSILKGTYYIIKILFSMLWALIYLRWQIWRSKKAFAKELQENGIPKDVAKKLTTHYNKQNKKLIGSLISAARFSRQTEKE